MVLNHFRNPTIGAFIITVLVVFIVGLVEFGSFGGAAKGKVPSQQNAAMCDPNDKSINATESRICGFPKTTGPSSAENSTATITGTTTPPSPSDNTTTQEAVPGVIP
jgi:cell division protein FtsN